jgi:hypothetical protein
MTSIQNSRSAVYAFALLTTIALASPARADGCEDIAGQLKGQIDGLKVGITAARVTYLSHPDAKEMSLGCRGRDYSNELYAKSDGRKPKPAFYDLVARATAIVFTVPIDDTLKRVTRCIKRMGIFRGDNVKRAIAASTWSATAPRPRPQSQFRAARTSEGSVSRARCSALRAASQNRDRTKHRRSLRPRLSSAPLRKSYALRCVRGTKVHRSRTCECIPIPVLKTSLILLASCSMRDRFLEAILQRTERKLAEPGRPGTVDGLVAGGALGGAAPSLGRARCLAARGGYVNPASRGASQASWRLPPLHLLARFARDWQTSDALRRENAEAWLFEI